MGFLIENGIRLVLLLQTPGWLEAPARFFSFLGFEDFYFLILPAIYWCIDAGLGVRIGFILLFSNSLTQIAKMTLHAGRPYWISTQVKALAAESSFGAPSGHALNAAGIWGTMAARLRRTWAWLVAAVIIFLIGLSRLVLGVHFPHDVLLGWLLGGITLWAFLTFWERVEAWIKRRSFVQQVLIALAVAAVAILIHGLLVFSLRDYVVPAEWMTNAARAGEPLPAPVSMDSVFTATGAFLGLAVGLAWIGQRGGFQPSGPLWKRALCFVVGLMGVLVLYIGLRLVLPSGGVILAAGMRMLRYALIGAWLTAGAPWVFARLHLLNPPMHEQA